MNHLTNIGRWLFWLQLGGATIACDGAGAEISTIYICVALLVALAFGIACGWTAYLEGHRAGERSKDNTNDK